MVSKVDLRADSTCRGGHHGKLGQDCRPPVSMELGSLLASTGLVIALIAVTPSGASTSRLASQSAFCHTIMTIDVKSPAMTNYKTYRAWAVAYLPTYQKLAAQAPNAAVRSLLNRIVSIMKATINFTSIKAFAGYISTHRAQWASDWLALTKAIGACISSIGAVG